MLKLLLRLLLLAAMHLYCFVVSFFFSHCYIVNPAINAPTKHWRFIFIFAIHQTEYG